MNQNSGPVVVLGSANVDLVVEVERRPAGGETVLGSDTVVLPGGKGANTAVAAARVGGRVAFLGTVGTDPHGDLLLDALRSAGVDTSAVGRSTRPTGTAYITVTPDGENSIVVSAGANGDLPPGGQDEHLPGAGGVLVVSLEIPVPAAEHAVAAAQARGARPVLNLSPVARLSAATLGALDPLVVNEHEAAWLLDGARPDPRRLLALGPKSVVITLGARGAVLCTADDPTEHEVSAPQVTPVDTTGAGDAFTGALAARLAAGDDLRQAAELAVRVAAFSVTRQGAQPSYPTLAELG